MGTQGDRGGGSRGLAGIFNCLKQELYGPYRAVMWYNKIPYYHCSYSCAASAGAGLGSSPCSGRTGLPWGRDNCCFSQGQFWQPGHCTCLITRCQRWDQQRVGLAAGQPRYPGRGHLVVACAPSLLPAACSAGRLSSALAPLRLQQDPAFGRRSAAPMCRGARTNAARGTALIHAPC